MGSDKNLKRDILQELFANRTQNIELAASWKRWEIEDQIDRAVAARAGFLMKNSSHDTRIIDEQIDQLKMALEAQVRQPEAGV